MNEIDDYIYDLENENITKTQERSNSFLSLGELANELTVSCTYVNDFNRVTRSTQTTINEITDLKNVQTIYKNINKNLKTVYNAIKVNYNKKINDSVQELHNNIIQQLLQIEKSYKQNLNIIRQAYHTELVNFKIQYKNYQNETLKTEHDKQLLKIINEKNYYADETVKMKKIINELNNKLFRLKYILVQKYPAKVKQLFSEKNTDLNDILDPRDLQIESAMQHLQVDKLKKDNEIRNLKKKLNKVKNDLNKKLEDETEYITVEKHKAIVKELREDLELSKHLMEKEKDKEINRLFVESKKLKSIYEAQLLSMRKMQNKTNIGHVLERQSKILELSRIFFPRIINQNSALSSSQIDIKDENSTNTTTLSKKNSKNNLLNENKIENNSNLNLSKKTSKNNLINDNKLENIPNSSLSKKNSVIYDNKLENIPNSSLSKKNSVIYDNKLENIPNSNLSKKNSIINDNKQESISNISLSKKNSIIIDNKLEKISNTSSSRKINSVNDKNTSDINNKNLSTINKNNFIFEKRNSLLSRMNKNNNNNINEDKPVRPFTSYFPSEYVRKKE
eukprot:jgi/Orpsp1_1/1179834/evm.model.c7180000070977.1